MTPHYHWDWRVLKETVIEGPMETEAPKITPSVSTLFPAFSSDFGTRVNRFCTAGQPRVLVLRINLKAFRELRKSLEFPLTNPKPWES